MTVKHSGIMTTSRCNPYHKTVPITLKLAQVTVIEVIQIFPVRYEGLLPPFQWLLLVHTTVLTVPSIPSPILTYLIASFLTY